MDLKIFFDVIDETVYETVTDVQSFVHAIRIHDTKFPDWKNADIAIIGVVESRGNIYTQGVENAANIIRKKLYKLKKGAASIRIMDLGNLRNGVKLEDTYLRLREVCEILMQYNVIPLIIGGTHDMDYGQFLAYEKFEKLISIVNIDAIIDVEAHAANGANRNHTHQILMHEPNYLFNFANIAYQSFLNDPETLEILEKLNFENFRIGQVKEHIEEMEPVVRQADMVSFDITSVRISDAPGNPNATPFGLTGEEACRLAWYAGISNKLSSFGIYEYDPTEDIKGQTASVIATMVWYFVEGYYNRKSDLNFQGDNFTRFIVTMKNNPHKLIFYKNKLTEMWWMEVPFPTDKEKFSRVSIVPCSYNDYEIATKGELPNRWISTHAKLI
ncbi:MAG: formimidoylglutamase [Bacteroidota bacterium]|nr:formimidoylglutamase [Bacteroidota bacterium]